MGKDIDTVVKLCECGCGLATNISKRTDRRAGCTKGRQNRFIKGHRFTGTSACNWKGGRIVHGKGYIMLRMPGHHRASSRGYVLEHIVIAENVLGEKLPKGAQVHHYGERSDNRKIVICENQEYHRLLHMRSESLAATGDPKKRKCYGCHEYDDIENLICFRCGAAKNWRVFHLECAPKLRARKGK